MLKTKVLSLIVMFIQGIRSFIHAKKHQFFPEKKIQQYMNIPPATIAELHLSFMKGTSEEHEILKTLEFGSNTFYFLRSQTGINCLFISYNNSNESNVIFGGSYLQNHDFGRFLNPEVFKGSVVTGFPSVFDKTKELTDYDEHGQLRYREMFKNVNQVSAKIGARIGETNMFFAMYESMNEPNVVHVTILNGDECTMYEYTGVTFSDTVTLLNKDK